MQKFFALPLLFCAALQLAAQETLLRRYPSVSSDKIAFAYGPGIRVVGRDGSNPQRLTIHPDVE